MNKRDAHLAEIRAAQAIQAEADASAARTWPISVHLTPFAPGCASLPLNHPRRWVTIYGRPSVVVLKMLLRRLDLRPEACAAALEGASDVALLAPVEPERLKLLSAKDGEPVPQAIFWDGLSLDQLRADLASLVKHGWAPPPKLGAVAALQPAA